MIEFVVREGPMFEAIIMNKEKNNPEFRFLFDNKSQDHVYYRWKLYSILQGETPSEWRPSDFRMFRGGSLWRPPPLNPYLHDNAEEEGGEGGERGEGAEEENASQEEEEEVKKGQLKAENRQKLETLVKELTPLREEISGTMVFCLNRAEAAEEVVSHIAESFGLIQTPLQKKIARLYLISDILHNSCAKVKNASYYRKYFEIKLPQIFKDMNLAYKNIQARLQAEQFKQKVMCCFRAWEDWAIYPESYLISLQNIFLGLVKAEETVELKPEREDPPDLDGAPLDGLPLDGAALDGVPLDGHAPLDLDGAPLGWDPLDGLPVDDLDGVPLGGGGGGGGGATASADDIDGMPLDEANSVVSTLALSKWEQMGDTEAFSQGRTESKWDSVVDRDSEEDNGSSANQGAEGGESDNDSSDEDSGGVGEDADFASSLKSFQMSEGKRKRLRELEVKVMKVQDELESGKRPRKCGRSVQQQVEHYRNKLLQKEFDQDREEKRSRSAPKSKDRSKEDKRGGDKERRRGGEEDRDRRRGRSRDTEETSCSSPLRTTKSPKRSKRSKSPLSPDRKSSLRSSRSRSPHRSHKSKKSKR